MEKLRARLEEAEETLRAIRSGEVDALVVNGPRGEQVFTLEGADHGYRILVETMTEGAVTLRDNGIIFYCNARFAAMIKMPLEKVIGLHLQQFILPTEISAFERLVSKDAQERRAEFMLGASDGTRLPILLSSALPEEATGTVWAVLTDCCTLLIFHGAVLTILKKFLNLIRSLRLLCLTSMKTRREFHWA